MQTTGSNVSKLPDWPGCDLPNAQAFGKVTLAAIAQKLPELPVGARVLGFAYDTGERYLSVDGFLPT